MIYTFEVELQSRPLQDPGIHGAEMYRGEVHLGRAQVFWCIVSNPGGPNAREDMCDDVMVQFARQLAGALTPP